MQDNSGFMEWFNKLIDKQEQQVFPKAQGEAVSPTKKYFNRNPYDPEHYYDYEGLFHSNPSVVPEGGHFPSTFKTGEGKHPRQWLVNDNGEWFNTTTGKPEQPPKEWLDKYGARNMQEYLIKKLNETLRR